MEDSEPITGSPTAAPAPAPPSSVMNLRLRSGRDVRFIARPPHRNRTCGFPAYGSCQQRDELATFQFPMSPVLPTERIAHLSRQGAAALRDFNDSR
jgi:hypothetical protein